MAAIVNSGKNYINENLAGNVPSKITRFVLANVAHADPDVAVNMDETMPDSADIVYDEPITRIAKINTDAVVFSQILMSNIGDFYFNWIGLATDDGTLIAVVYVSIQHKVEYSETRTGNSLTRNIILQFTNAADALNVTIEPETWQFDFTQLIYTEIENALSEISRFNDVNEKNETIKIGSLNIFSQTCAVDLSAAADKSQFDVMVDDAVNLSAGDVLLNAPEGETIRYKNSQFDSVRIVVTNTVFKFYRTNGEWRV